MSPYVLHGQLEPLVLAAVTVVAYLYQEVHMMSIVHAKDQLPLSWTCKTTSTDKSAPPPLFGGTMFLLLRPKKCQCFQWKVLRSDAVTSRHMNCPTGLAQSVVGLSIEV